MDVRALISPSRCRRRRPHRSNADSHTFQMSCYTIRACVCVGKTHIYLNKTLCTNSQASSATTPKHSQTSDKLHVVMYTCKRAEYIYSSHSRAERSSMCSRTSATASPTTYSTKCYFWCTHETPHHTFDRIPTDAAMIAHTRAHSSVRRHTYIHAHKRTHRR